MTGHERGRRGETVAARYLTQKGYEILERNFRTTRGEVDIVCGTAGLVVFVEVKSWRFLDREALGDAIDHRKRRRITSVARRYLRERCPGAPPSVRFDVVYVPSDNGMPYHIQGAFESAWPE